VPQQQRQRLVLPELVEIFSPPAAHIANRLSTISEALRPRLRRFTVISRSITAAVPVWRNASINPGTPAWPVISPVSSSTSISKSSRSAIPVPPHPAGET